MVPTNRLMIWTAVLVVPCAAVAAALPSAAPAGLALIALFAVIVLADAAGAMGRLDGVHVDVTPVTRLSKNQPGKIEFTVRSNERPFARLRLGLPVPPALVSCSEDLVIQILEAGKTYRAAWMCTAVQRGRHHLRACHLECASPAGFWDLRRKVDVDGEVRVYPDLRSERKRVAALFLRRGDLGMRMRRQVGKGREFEKLREYQPGDSYEDIHWKATAKRRHPVTKLFRVERTQEVYVLIDASRLSARLEPGPGKTGGVTAPSTLLEGFIASSLILGLAAEQQGDLFGLLTFHRKVQGCIKAGRGAAHYNACRDALYTVQPEIVSPDYGELCSFVRVRLRKRALLVILTSLDDPVLAESLLEQVRLICRQHLVVVMMMKPPEAQPLFADGDVGRIDDVYRHIAGHTVWRKLREVGKDLARHGVQFVQADHAKLSARLVSEYMSVKQKQIL